MAAFLLADGEHSMIFNRPSILIRIEATVIFLVSIFIYRHLHASWLLYAALFFVPDIFMLGYLFNARTGSAVYNLVHTFTVPIVIFLVAFSLKQPAFMAPATIWISHIAFDRFLGYGLKYPTQFKDTHLQHLD